MKILVVDDNETHRNAAKAQLGKENEVTVASEYSEAQKLLGYGDYSLPLAERNQHSFDAVLVDLLMPGPQEQQADKWKGSDETMAAGTFLAVLAGKNGAKLVGLLTDTDHHHSPASECIDAIQQQEGSPSPFTINEATVVFSNNRNWIGNFDPNDLGLELKWNDEKGVRAKNWKALLNYLLNLPEANN